MNPEPAQTPLSMASFIAGVIFILAAIYAFFTSGWVIGLCLIAIAMVMFSLGAILDLLHEIFKSLRRLETSTEKKEEKSQQNK